MKIQDTLCVGNFNVHQMDATEYCALCDAENLVCWQLPVQAKSSWLTNCGEWPVSSASSPTTEWWKSIPKFDTPRPLVVSFPTGGTFLFGLFVVAGREQKLSFCATCIIF